MEIIKDGNSKIPVEIVTIVEKSTDKVIVFITNYVSDFLSKFTQTISALPTIGIYTFITLLATYFICTDKMYIKDTIEHQIPQRWAKKIGVHSNDIIKSLGGYLKAEAILIIISFFIVLTSVLTEVTSLCNEATSLFMPPMPSFTLLKSLLKPSIFSFNSAFINLPKNLSTEFQGLILMGAI